MNDEHPGMDEFEKRYTFVANPNPHAEGAPACHMFETFGEDIEFVYAQPRERVWTLIDGGDDRLYLDAGFHVTNRLGFFVTREEWAEPDESYLYAPKGDAADETAKLKDPSFLIRFRDSEYARLRKLIEEGETEEALGLLEHCRERPDRCLWITVFGHRHGNDLYIAVGDEAPDPTALVSRLSDWEGEHASETLDTFDVTDIRRVRQSEDFQVAYGTCPQCSGGLPHDNPEGCSFCGLCVNCCRHSHPARVVEGTLDNATQTQ